VKNILIIFFLCLLAANDAGAQTVLLNVDRNNETRPSEIGPNLKRFTHFMIRGGLVASPDKPGARIVYGGSFNLAFGIRRKFKVSSVYSLGYDIENQYTDYKFKQEKGKVVPDTVLNNIAGRLDYSTLGIGFYNRINFDPSRGNFLGTFFDLGIMGEWHYSIKSISKNDLDNGNMAKTTVKHLKFVYNTSAKVYCRLGFSHLSLYASYRITDLFKPSFNYPDLPRVIAGIDLAVF
jgi:hypothetical protein